MGALGVAILAKKEKEREFDFNIIDKEFTTTAVNCGKCPNNCEIICIKENGKLIDSYGNRCERGVISK